MAAGSAPIRTRCAAPSCGSRVRAASWTARFASTIHDEPRGLYWDTAGLLVVAYGFHTFGLDAAIGRSRWEHRSATPIVALLGSPRLAHVIVQAEIETFAIEPDGTVAWRVAHSDVVTAAELIGGRLVLTGFDGQLNALDPVTGRSASLIERSRPSARRRTECGQTVDNPRGSDAYWWTTRR